MNKSLESSKNLIILGSLAMDLKRVSLGYQHNSMGMAERFYEEALKRKREVNMEIIKPYLKTILEKIELIKNEDNGKVAEDALMFSTLIQNYTQVF